MIKVAGVARKSFLFPADLATAYAYYSDLGYILHYLPHISVVKVHASDHYRVLYSSDELGMYTIRIFCDLRATLDGGRHLIRILPEEGVPPVQPSASFYAASGRGQFQMEALFTEAGFDTQVDFTLHLHARLPKPRGMRFMVNSVLDRVTRGITETRIQEVVDGFVERTTLAFPDWVAMRQP